MQSAVVIAYKKDALLRIPNGIADKRSALLSIPNGIAGKAFALLCIPNGIVGKTSGMMGRVTASPFYFYVFTPEEKPLTPEGGPSN